MAKSCESTPLPRESGKGRDEHFSEDLEHRSRNLGLALMHKGVLKGRGDVSEEERAQRGATYAVKLSSEFLAGIIVGAVLGIGFDKLVGSSPWGLLFFLLLGFSAGVLNLLRSMECGALGQSGQRSMSFRNKEDDEFSQRG